MAAIEDRYTAAELTSLNPFIPVGLLMMERDTGKLKLGHGGQWTSTSYWPPASSLGRPATGVATGAIPGTTLEDAVNNTRYGIVGAAGVLNATNTFADVTGLTWSVLAGATYVLEGYLWATAEITTVGVQYGINGPTIGAGTIRFGAVVPTAATTVEFIAGATFQTAQTTTSTPSTTVPHLTVMSGAVTLGATAGTLAVQFRSETTDDAIIAGGSWGRLTRIA